MLRRKKHNPRRQWSTDDYEELHIVRARSPIPPGPPARSQGPAPVPARPSMVPLPEALPQQREPSPAPTRPAIIIPPGPLPQPQEPSPGPVPPPIAATAGLPTPPPPPAKTPVTVLSPPVAPHRVPKGVMFQDVHPIHRDRRWTLHPMGVAIAGDSITTTTNASPIGRRFIRTVAGRAWMCGTAEIPRRLPLSPTPSEKTNSSRRQEGCSDQQPNHQEDVANHQEDQP